MSRGRGLENSRARRGIASETGGSVKTASSWVAGTLEGPQPTP